MASPAAAQIMPPPSSGIARVGDFFDLADIGGASQSGAGGQSKALDVLHGDIVAYTDKLCRQVETATRGQVDALRAEYAAFRREEIAELDRIAAEEAALEDLQRRIDDGAAQTSAGSPAGTGVSAEVAAKERLADARKEVGRLETRLRLLGESTRPLIDRHAQFRAARRQAHEAGKEIARLEILIGGLRSGDIEPNDEDLGGLGASMGRRNLVSELERELEVQRAARADALGAIAEALPAHPVPESMEGFTDPKTGGLKGTLYREWQTYQAELGPIETGLAEARAEEQAAFDTLAQIQRDASGSGASAAVSKDDLVADYRRRGARLVVARTVALLAYQLHGNVTACIEKRAAALDKGSDEDTQPTAKIHERTIHAHVLDTCYGSTLGPHKHIAGNFVFHPWTWERFQLRVGPGHQVRLGDNPGRFSMPSAPGGSLERLTRTALGADGSFSVEWSNPTPPTKNGLYRRSGGGIVPETNYPYRLEGRLIHDPTAPQEWRGSGTGRILYRIVESGPDWEVVHDGEPCNITWDLSEVPPR